MAVSSVWSIKTPDLSDPFLPTLQLAAMAQDVDEGLSDSLDPVRFMRSAAGANLFLDSGFSNMGAVTTFTPPAKWGSYRVFVQAAANLKECGNADEVECLIYRITTGDTASGILTRDDGGVTRAVFADMPWDGLVGPQDFFFRIRNASGTRGRVTTSWMTITAVRMT